jgi:transcriptional regulator GlxA family with amidase domain
LSSCLSALGSHGERLDPRIAEPASEALLRLVALTAGIAPELQAAGRDAARAATIVRIARHIEKHYGDVALSPSSAAKALGMSVRQLHLLCAETGRSFGERLAEHRLEEARRLLMLTSPSSRERPIAEIAFAVGFNDLSTFYRAFRARWASTPGDVRAETRTPAAAR